MGSVLTLSAADLTFEQFQWADLTWALMGHAEVVASNYAVGTPAKELDMRAINAHFTLHQGANRVRFRYADLDGSADGNVNFAVNGDFRNVSAISSLNGVVVGGANVTVNAVNSVGWERGEVEITTSTGTVITDFLVGGQEFFLDDVCQYW